MPHRLLLVDDDPRQLKLMKLTLEDHGYTVDTAQDGHEALQIIPLHPPDGVISDVLMPRLDGYQLCHALRNDDRFSHLPIVLLSSALADPDNLRLAEDVGANALLTRTPDVQHLARQAVQGLKAVAGLPESAKPNPSDLNRRLAEVHYPKYGVPRRVDSGDDMTELKMTQAQFRQSQKLESIGQIAAGVVHELNNPLTAILGFIECLLRRPDAPDIVNVLHTMEREGLRCRTLIQDMLIYTHKPADHPAWAQLPQLADGILGLIEARAKTMHIAIEKHYEERIPLALVNGNQIQQVLINLCTNALDAMPEGGTLSVTIGVAGRHFILRVSDTGQGMPEEQIRRIFEPFFTTKEAGKGTGLGLSLVQNIVNDHRGRVDVRSEVGRGTTFEVILPRGGPSQ